MRALESGREKAVGSAVTISSKAADLLELDTNSVIQDGGVAKEEEEGEEVWEEEKEGQFSGEEEEEKDSKFQ